VVDRDELSRLLTGGEWSPLNRALDVHVCNLRRKLMTVMQAESVITSFRGIGYMLRAAVRIDE
jgi:DNA-binding response OmpR family regulator